MQLDIYSRPEPAHKLSYLAVPAGKEIPQEVINVDWHLHATTVELDEQSPSFKEYGIDSPGAQIKDKGYAITSLAHQVEAQD